MFQLQVRHVTNNNALLSHTFKVGQTITNQRRDCSRENFSVGARWLMEEFNGRQFVHLPCHRLGTILTSERTNRIWVVISPRSTRYTLLRYEKFQESALIPVPTPI